MAISVIDPLTVRVVPPVTVTPQVNPYESLGYVEETPAAPLSPVIPPSTPTPAVLGYVEESPAATTVDQYASWGYVEEKTTTPVESTAYPQSRIAPSTIAGDIERTAGSAFSGLMLSGLNAVKGVADLNAKIPLPQFIDNLRERTGASALEGQIRQKVDSMIEEWGQYREQVQNEIRAEGGLPTQIMQNIGDSALNTAVMLASIGASGFTGVGATARAAVKEAIKFGGLMAATTPGDMKERAKAGAHAAAMMLLPIPASKLPTDWMAKAANILGLNVLSVIAGDYNIQQAKDKAVANGTPDEWAKEWFAEGVPPFVINAMFGIMAKSAKRGNPDAKILTENIPEEIKPLIEGTKQLAETKPDLVPSPAPKLPSTPEISGEAPATGALMPELIQSGGIIRTPLKGDGSVEANADKALFKKQILELPDGTIITTDPDETGQARKIRKVTIGQKPWLEDAKTEELLWTEGMNDGTFRSLANGIVTPPLTPTPEKAAIAAGLRTTAQPEVERGLISKPERPKDKNDGRLWDVGYRHAVEGKISNASDYGTRQDSHKYRVYDDGYKAGKASLQPPPEAGKAAELMQEVDPNTLTFREKEQHRVESMKNIPTKDFSPLVTILDENGERTILDGHNRAVVAKERGDKVNTVDLTRSEYEKLAEAGFDDMEISWAALRRWEMSSDAEGYADELNRQFSGANVSGEGEKALELLEAKPAEPSAPIAKPAEPGAQEAKFNIVRYRMEQKAKRELAINEITDTYLEANSILENGGVLPSKTMTGQTIVPADMPKGKRKLIPKEAEEHRGIPDIFKHQKNTKGGLPLDEMADQLGISEDALKEKMIGMAKHYDDILSGKSKLQEGPSGEDLQTEYEAKYPESAKWEKTQEQVRKTGDQVVSDQLHKGDSFTIGGEKYSVVEEGETGLTVKDGRELFIPYETPTEKSEQFFIDKGSLKKPEAESRGELALGKQDLSLTGQKVTDTERIQREKDAAIAKQAELERRAQPLPGMEPTPEVARGVAKPTEQSFNVAMNAGTKIINPNTGKLYTEHDLRTSLEVAGIVDPGKARYDAMSSEQRIEAVNHLNTLSQERKPLGADAANRIGVLTTFGTEPGRERIKSLLQTTIESEKTLPDTKAELGKRDPLYEQQRSKQLKDVVLGEFTKDPSLISEAEAFMRDPKEPMDTKGVIGVALFEHYRNTGNNAAQLALFDLVDPLSLGAGRFSQAWSMLNALTGKNWITTMDRYLTRRNVKLPEDIRAEIETSFAEAAKIKDPDAHTQAIHAIISKINTYVPFKTGTWWDAYRYTNMLFNPQSHERNIYGNNVQAFVTRPLVLIARGNFSGAHTYITKAWQDVMNGNALRVAKESFNSDYSKFAEYLNTPNTSVFERMQMEDGPIGAKQRLAWKALTFIPKMLNAQDKFFGSLIEAGETARLLEDGMSPANAQANAHILAEKLLYRERLGGSVDASLPAFSRALDRAADLMEKARTSDQPLISWPSKLFIPFLRTPIRIAQFSVEASPLAYLGPKMNVENIARAKYGKFFDKLNTSDQLAVKEILEFRKGLAAVGTVITLMGVGAAMTGNTTWSAPQDPDAKKYFYASGRRPYSFRVGNRWIPMMYLGPFFLAYALPAAARDAFADNPASVDSSMISRLALAASGIPRIILSQTPMSGMASLIDAVQGKIDKTVGAAIGFTGSQFIPASGLLRWFDKIVDPTYRRPVTVMETIKAGIPGLSIDLKAYLDANGKDAERTWTDIYLPYTIGANDKRNEQYLKVRNEQIRAEIAVREMQRR